ncbi:hypothetical protein PGB90_008921 [Kerria lacca]
MKFLQTQFPNRIISNRVPIIYTFPVFSSEVTSWQRYLSTIQNYIKIKGRITSRNYRNGKLEEVSKK